MEPNEILNEIKLKIKNYKESHNGKIAWPAPDGYNDDPQLKLLIEDILCGEGSTHENKCANFDIMYKDCYIDLKVSERNDILAGINLSVFGKVIENPEKHFLLVSSLDGSLISIFSIAEARQRLSITSDFRPTKLSKKIDIRGFLPINAPKPDGIYSKVWPVMFLNGDISKPIEVDIKKFNFICNTIYDGKHEAYESLSQKPNVSEDGKFLIWLSNCFLMSNSIMGKLPSSFIF